MTALQKEPILDALFEEWEVLDQLLSSVSGDAWFTPSPLPGWTVHDIAAHLIGTESMLAGIPAPHTTVDVHGFAHVRNEIGAFNEQWVEGLRGCPGSEMLERFRAITERRRSELAAMTDEMFEAETATPVGPAPYLRFMRIRVFDCWMHELDLREALGVAGNEGGTRGETAFEEIAGAVAFLVGKRGKAPEGSRITFELTGPLAREIHVAVDGRAAVVDELPSAATTTITLDSRLFTRLAGGRVKAADHRDAVSISGDTAVGKQIVDNLAFTI
ncbi:maleylpyruvate isomerase family mycothiol-dependent enzyme [Rhodococcus tibetensis]|uniref:Maleylpyruvate isomerase family mycothiol-dependent enzyme n=1 Tax=Rhodococcus tibetensis TaxID=2965064 RepID=A0ABT1QIA1_9NOCA|nr:maleylpyruvate isomerase family mycothiol-dependent enzyme [Rhodococcus sp. FXJ9.536]MCQ4122016.1 maleylpyruvate isomerase family mycothiol-dependent enzyme [Rhodococcus sp. FXJ9.536]